MKKFVLLLLFVLLESCSIKIRVQNGAAGKPGENSIGAEKGKNGAAGENGKDKETTIGLDLNATKK
jgi:hypothetical protein